jgi:hypothetical protein
MVPHPPSEKMCWTVGSEWRVAKSSYITGNPSTKGTYTNIDHRCGQHIELTLINHPYTPQFHLSLLRFSFLMNSDEQ